MGAGTHRHLGTKQSRPASAQTLHGADLNSLGDLVYAIDGSSETAPLHMYTVHDVKGGLAANAKDLTEVLPHKRHCILPVFLALIPQE